MQSFPKSISLVGIDLQTHDCTSVGQFVLVAESLLVEATVV